MDDAKEIWAAIKTRFGGNANSKKMQKAVLKQQFEAFTITSKESLEKGYDRFQKLLSQLDALGAGVSDEDANHKFLRSLPTAWDNIQKTSSSSQASENVAFLSQAKASSSKHKPSHSSGNYRWKIYWQIAMTAIKIKKFYKKTGRRPRVDGKMHVAFDKRKCKLKGCFAEPLHEGQIQLGRSRLKMRNSIISIVKLGLGHSIKSNAEVLGYEEEMSRGIFVLRETDEGYYDIPLYSRFKQCLLLVPLFSPPSPSNDSDGELGAVSNDSSTHYSTCQSNDSDGELGTSNAPLVKDEPFFIFPPYTFYRTINTGRVNVNTARVNVNTGYGNVSSVSSAGTHIKSGSSRFNTGKQNINSGSVHVNTARVNRPVSNQTSQGKVGTAVKTSAGCVWRTTIPLSNTNSGPIPDSNDHPLKHMEHRGIFDSGCSGHMTGNRAHLEDYQELSKEGSVTFGGSKGSISGKGTIRLGNLVFDDVAFVKELGHFTEKECFVVSSDFKMPDENQVLLKVP
ncbi:hypothetical protein Tco_0052945, partial [Tanacetum coccineum]